MSIYTHESTLMKPGQVSLIAYGSLLNLESFEHTFGKPYSGARPTCLVRGWRRSWDTAMPNEGFYEETSDGPLIPERISYMNVRPSPKDVLNAVLYFVDESDIEAFDAREWTYDRIVVDWSAEDGFPPDKGEAYMYVAKPDWLLTPGRPRTWAAVRRTYLDVIAKGVKRLGESFAAKYAKSTDPVRPDLILNDRYPAPDYPQSAELDGI